MIAAFDKARGIWQVSVAFNRPPWTANRGFPSNDAFLFAIRERAEADRVPLDTADDWLTIAQTLADEALAAVILAIPRPS